MTGPSGLLLQGHERESEMLAYRFSNLQINLLVDVDGPLSGHLDAIKWVTVDALLTPDRLGTHGKGCAVWQIIAGGFLNVLALLVERPDQRYRFHIERNPKHPFGGLPHPSDRK